MLPTEWQISRLYVGVDLGQSSDPTAISVVQRRAEGTGQWERVGNSAVRARELPITSYQVRHLERVPLRTAYPENILARPPLAGNCDLVIDHTGVGKPVFDLFQRSGLFPIGITITGGFEPSGSGRLWHVPKSLLISTLDARLSTKELRFAAGLVDGLALASELQDFRTKNNRCRTVHLPGSCRQA